MTVAPGSLHPPRGPSLSAIQTSTIALVLLEPVVDLEPRVCPGHEQMAVGSDPRGVVERARLEGYVFGIDIEFRQQRRAAVGAEVPVDCLARITRSRVSAERSSNLQRRSVYAHIRHERRATLPLAVATVAEVHVVGCRRENVADRPAKASAFESSFHGRYSRPDSKKRIVRGVTRRDHDSSTSGKERTAWMHWAAR